MPTPTLLQGVLIGALATLFMDVLNLAGSRTGAVGLFRPAFLGRWVGHMFRGTFTHSDIRAAPPIRWELALGELAHYSIGGALGAFYVLLSDASGVSPARMGWAVAYGALTTVFAWFLMFPSFGFGVCGKAGPPAMAPMRTSTYNHVNFGLGLGLLVKLLT